MLRPELTIDNADPAAVPSGAAHSLRCRSGGRLRNFIRQRILLWGWQPRQLPQAAPDQLVDLALTQLVGADSLRDVAAAMGGADEQARQVGGCARDAYTVLYACAGMAVLAAACGVAAPGNNLVLNLLVLAELIMLLVLLLTFRKAHRVNWHSHWLALRFHVEFLRVMPILAALRADSLHARLARDGRDGDTDAAPPHAPHLAVLGAHHHRGVDPAVAGQTETQRRMRARLYGQLRARFDADPATYAADALRYAELIAGQQLRYHCLRAQQEHAIVHRVHRLSMMAFGLTIVAVLAHFWWHAALLTIICTGVPAFAASLHGFVAQEESERLASSYTAMAVRLQAWLDRDAPAGALDAAQERLGELVELLLSEVQDWHRLFGDKGMYHLG
jgi:hypothetical protein